MQPQRESTGLFVRDPATAGLPGRDAATTGFDGIFDESKVSELGSVPSCTPVAAEAAGVATGRPSGPEGPTPTDSWPAAGAPASLATGAATLLTAGAATSPATASLGFMLCRSRPCVSSVPRSVLSQLFRHKRKGFLWYFAVLYGGARGTHAKIGYKGLRKKNEEKKYILLVI